VWGVIGALIATVALIVHPATVDAGEGPFWAALIIGRAGFVAGVAAGLALMIAERRHAIRDLRLPRVAMWGALGGLALPWLGAAPSAMVAILAVMGAGTAVGAVSLARRGESDSV
jgi:hypothetical protein